MGPPRDLAALLQSPEWAQGKPQDDWVMRLFKSQKFNPHMPNGGFQDDIFRAPVAPGTETLDFDRMIIDPSQIKR
jgi:hypothetical protein